MGIFEEALRTRGTLVLDGAFATELEKYGCDLKDPLWSAKVLFEAPELVKKVHLSYLAAGADIVESAGYQATVEGFEAKGFSHEEAVELVKLSVKVAVDARDAFVAARDSGAREIEGFAIEGRNLEKPLVAASVGPYGAYLADGSEYKGYEATVTTEFLADFHRERLALFASELPDLFGCETIPSLVEAKALIEVLADDEVSRGVPAWISFSCKDEKYTCGGDLISDCAKLIDGADSIVGIGINCTEPKYVTSLIREIRAVTDKAIFVYPNTGEHYDEVNKCWYGEADAFDAFSKEWHATGANVLGGCCRTSPENIRRIADWVHV